MKRFRSLVRNALGLLLLAMVLLNVANAAGRYLFRKAIPGSDEILVFSMVWLVFVGACLVSLDGRHLGFNLLTRVLGARERRLLHSAICLTTAALTGFVTVQSWAVIEKLYSIGQRSMATEIPMVIPHAAVPVSFALISVMSLIFAFRPAAPPPRMGDTRNSSSSVSESP